MNKRLSLFFIFLFIGITGYLQACYGQNFANDYDAWRKKAAGKYESFRHECNTRYAQFLREAWSSYKGETREMPPEEKPVPPQPFIEPIHENTPDTTPDVTPDTTPDIVPDTTPDVIPDTIPLPSPDSTPEVIPDRENIEPPVIVEPTVPAPQPLPIEPIRETPLPRQDNISFNFFGTPLKARIPTNTDAKLNARSTDAIADAWLSLSSDDAINNTIRDCLETRIRLNLCDWAYLQFLDTLASNLCPDKNFATLLAAYLFCQSGYQMRLGLDGDKLVLLYGSRHTIFRKMYFKDGGDEFYPYGETSGEISMCNMPYEGETPLSLLIPKEQKLGDDMSQLRQINSKRYYDMKIESQVPVETVNFFDTYPTSCLDNNPLTRWAMYANTPLSKKTRDMIYPALIETIQDKTQLEAANRLLNWIQTGFVYEYDDEVWGQDRAFFAEETLYYPYCDCEDRSILFSRLVRDLLGIDVALIYYPGHLATAVCFDKGEKVDGDAISIGGRRFTICDPTYIGAPVGAQMPGLSLAQTEAILLNR